MLCVKCVPASLSLLRSAGFGWGGLGACLPACFGRLCGLYLGCGGLLWVMGGAIKSRQQPFIKTAGFVYSCGLGWIWGYAGRALAAPGLMARSAGLGGGRCLPALPWVVGGVVAPSSALPALGGGVGCVVGLGVWRCLPCLPWVGCVVGLGGGGSISCPACLGWWGWVCGGVGCVVVSALPALGGVGWWWLLLPCLLPCLPCRHPRHLKRLWRVRTLPFLPSSFVVWVRCDSSGVRLLP